MAATQPEWVSQTEQNMLALNNSLLPVLLGSKHLSHELNVVIKHAMRVQKWQDKLKNAFPFLNEHDSKSYQTQCSPHCGQSIYPKETVLTSANITLSVNEKEEGPLSEIYWLQYNTKKYGASDGHEGIHVVKHLNPSKSDWSDNVYPERWSKPLEIDSPEFEIAVGRALYESLPSLTNTDGDLFANVLFGAYEKQRIVSQ